METSGKFRIVIFWLFVLAEAFICLVSFYTSRLGLMTVTDSALVASAVALAGAVFAFMVYLFLSKYFPGASAGHKVAYGVLFILFAVLLYGFSTQFSVITLGGREAINIHYQTVITESDRQGLEMLKRGSEEANLIPQLENLANQFENYASREANGAFSGKAGKDDVFNTLVNTSTTLRGLANSVKETERQRKLLYEDLKTEIGEARQTISTDDDLRKVNIQFGKDVSEINELITRMSKTTSFDFINNVNRNLASLTFVVDDETADWQKKAIERLRENIGAAQKIVKKMIERSETEELQAETFTMITMSNAITKYAPDIAYAWAYGLSLDYSPVFFVILLAILGGTKQVERRIPPRRREVTEFSKVLE